MLPELTPLDTPIFDDLVVEEMEGTLDRDVTCDGRECSQPGVARVVLPCPCRATRIGCATHVAETVAYFAEGGRVLHKTCGVTVSSCRVVTL